MLSPADPRPDAPRPADLVLRGRRVVAGGRMEPAAVHVRDGIITAVTAWDDVPPDVERVDVGDAVLMPGLVDTHVHINEPGRTEWEGFETATRAAASGGVTTLVEMPLNSIPATTTVVALAAKLAAARDRLHVDVGFWGGVVPENLEQLEPLWDAGVLGFKCFLCPSGVDEFAHVTETELRAALPELARLGAPLLAHAELPGPLARAALAVAELDPRSYGVYLASRPREAEQRAIALLLLLCRETGARIHVVHLADADSLPLLRGARAEGLPVTVETCPHYLHFAAEEIADGATDHKCAPPVREAENRERLWDALGAGEIDLVVTDHSPCPPAMKGLDTGDFLRAWGGIASLQLTLPVTWKGARERGYTPVQLAEWMCAAPARLAGLDGRKGCIAPGCDADFVVWHPEAGFTVDPARLHHRHPVTPYAGAALPGVVQATYLRGRRIYDGGRFPGGPSGRTLSRHTR
ncbi:MAG TPA: allantoinase AllB [Longimicrobium sp.]